MKWWFSHGLSRIIRDLLKPKATTDMKHTQTAFKTREQLEKFSGIFSPHFPKPTGKFIGDMLHGLQAAKDVKLSCIGRGLNEVIALKKTEERLSRHLKREDLAEGIHATIAQHAAQHIGQDTLLVIDPTDIRKLYAEKMPYLATIRDGDKNELGDGYWACAAVACENTSHRIVPLHLRLWSCEAPGFKSENDEILAVINTIRVSAGKRGIYVIDRGGDRGILLNHLLDNGLRFIIRLEGSRNLEWRKHTLLAEKLAAQCPMRYTEVIHRETERDAKCYELQYGSLDVRLPGREEALRLVVVKGFGEKPMLLLTNAAGTDSRKSLWSVVTGYLTRWRVEDAIRFIKQSYRLEDIRLLDYTRLRNMMAVVLAAVYFVAAWLGESIKRGILVRHITRVSKRLFGVPDFHYYALADGLSRLLGYCGRLCARATRARDDEHPELALYEPG